MSAPQDKRQAVAEAASPDPVPGVFRSNKPPPHDVHAVMNFEQLIAKVKQAEDALEAQERRFVADVRQFKRSWRSAWTPPRIVIAGLVTGFFAGRAEPLKVAGKGGSIMQMITMLSGLFATEKAGAAAKDAEKAAEGTEKVANEVASPRTAAQVRAINAAPTSDAVAAAARTPAPAPVVQQPEPARFVAPLD